MEPPLGVKVHVFFCGSPGKTEHQTVPPGKCKGIIKLDNIGLNLDDIWIHWIIFG